jgi:hypothetical protein
MKKRNIILIIVVIILAIIVGIRLYLPVFVRNQINNQIAEAEGINGGVDRVSMQIVAGSVQLHDIVIYNEQSADPTLPFIIVPYNEVSVHWRSLFRGTVVLDVLIDGLRVNFTRPDEEIDEEDLINLRELLEEIFPFRLERFTIANGRISFADVNFSPTLEVYMSDIFLEITNIHNLSRSIDSLPSSMHLDSRIMNTGTLHVDARFNLMRDTIPDFEYTMELENADLTEFNDYLSANAKVTINEGLLNLYSEAAARKGLLTGYMKPLIDKLEILPVEDEKDDNVLRKIWEGLLELVTNVLENPDTDIIATEVEFEGRIDDPDVDTWQAVWALLRNAFIESISPGIEDTINFEDLF